jgi:membrane protease YdiL (CAAX protease family)
VALQVPVTFLGWILAGLARQWTGSILYGTISHMGVNFIAWCAGLSGS